MATGDGAVARLRSLIRDVPDVPRPGIIFKDITALLGDAGALRDAVDLMAAPYRDSGIEIVAGVESRGFILGGAVAYVLNAGFAPVRKKGRLPGTTISIAYELEYGEAVLEMHADALVRQPRVLVVDDLLAPGGTATAAASLVEQMGGHVVGLAFLIELSQLAGEVALGSRPHTAVMRL